MVTENKIETTNSTGDWSDEYKGDKPKTDSNWFSDVVPEGELSFTAEIQFKTEGEKTQNKFGKEVIQFIILHEGKEKVLEISGNNFDVLHELAEHKPLIGKIVQWQRSGVGQKETRRKVKF